MGIVQRDGGGTTKKKVVETVGDYWKTHKAPGMEAPLTVVPKIDPAEYWKTHPAPGMTSNPLSNLIAGTNAGIVSRGGTGGSVSPIADIPAAPGWTPLTADLSKNPINAPYEKLLAFVKENAAGRSSEFEKAKATMKAQQEASNKDLYNAYLGSRLNSDASSNALGVDPAMVSAARDLAMRKSQENSDQALADNLAWTDKASLLKGDQLAQTQNSLASEQVNKALAWNTGEETRIQNLNLAQLKQMAADKVAADAAAAKARSSGGSRSSGGGGSSSSSGGVPTTSTITDTLTNSGLDTQAYNELLGSNPEAAALLLNATNLSGTDTSTVKYLQQGVNDLASKTYEGPQGYSYSPYNNTLSNPNSQRSLDALKKAAYEAALKAAMGYSGNFGSPKSSTVNKSTAKGVVGNS